MKKRIFNNWTITRAMYFVIGISVIVQSVISNQWFGVLFGTYFASMGLFAFGCAAGNCVGKNCNVEQKKFTNTHIPNKPLDNIKS